MKKFSLNCSLIFILFFCSTHFLNAVSQKVDTLVYKKGTKISERLYNLNIPVDSANPKAKSRYKHTFSNITGAGGYTDGLEILVHLNTADVGKSQNFQPFMPSGLSAIAKSDLRAQPSTRTTIKCLPSNRIAPEFSVAFTPMRCIRLGLVS